MSSRSVKRLDKEDGDVKLARSEGTVLWRAEVDQREGLKNLAAEDEQGRLPSSFAT